MSRPLPTLRLALLIGLLQGAALYLTSLLFERNIPPMTHLMVLVPVVAVLVLIPLTLHLFPAGFWGRRALGGLGGGLLMLTALGWYQGWALGLKPAGEADFERLVLFGFTLVLGWGLTVSLVQARHSGETPWPRAFMRQLVANVLTLGLAASALGVLWALLMLWAQLFRIVGVTFFEYLFSQRAFVLPVSAMVYGGVVRALRGQEDLFERVRQVPVQLAAWLAPLAAFIAVSFLLTLPFTGLQPIWDTGHASALMVALQLAVLGLTALAFTDEHRRPSYPAWLARAIAAALLLVPAFTVLCAWSLGLRVQQYGWSTDRVLAGLVVFTGGAWACAYAGSVLRKRMAWPDLLPACNVGLGILVGTLVVLMNSPAIDPERISVASQVSRLLSGRVAPADFDFSYLRVHGGRYGREALARLSEHREAAIRSMAAAALANRATPRLTAEQVRRTTRIVPAGKTLDEAFARYLAERGQQEPQVRDAYRSGQPVAFLAIDLDAAGGDEYVLLEGVPCPLFRKGAHGWSRVGYLESRHGWVTAQQVKEELSRVSPRVVPEVWRTLEVGSHSFGVRPMPADTSEP